MLYGNFGNYHCIGISIRYHTSIKVFAEKISLCRMHESLEKFSILKISIPADHEIFEEICNLSAKLQFRRNLQIIRFNEYGILQCLVI